VDYAAEPDYLVDAPGARPVIVPGRHDSMWLVSAMAAVRDHPSEDPSGGSLIETNFGSAADDFKVFGVYTARIYKNGKWSEVVTDTRIPCVAWPKQLPPPPGAKPANQVMVPIGARSEDCGEAWPPLLEKAFAKYHGSYESLNGGDIGEALVDLTGGSVETIALRSKAASALAEGPGGGKLWPMLEDHIADRCALVMVGVATAEDALRMREDEANAAEEERRKKGGLKSSASSAALHAAQHAAQPVEPVAAGPSGLAAGSGCTVLGLRHLDLTGGGYVDLVHLKSPFAGGGGACWSGDWGRGSAKWAGCPEAAQLLQAEGGVPLVVTAPDENGEEKSLGSAADDGTFWMGWADFLATFHKVFVCKVFPDAKFKQYCVHGEWVQENGSAGGSPRLSPTDNEVIGAVPTELNKPRKAPLALDSLVYWDALALRGNPAAIVRSGALATASCSWFSNPQYAVAVANGDKPVSVHLSLLQEERRRCDALPDNLSVGFIVVRSKAPVDGPDGRPGPPARVWAVQRAGDVVYDSTKAPLANGGSGWAAAEAKAEPRGDKGDGKGDGKGEAYPTPGPGVETPGHAATREVVAPSLVLSPGYVYTVVPHTEKQGLDARFVLRVFAPAWADLAVAPVPPPHRAMLEGAWASQGSALGGTVAGGSSGGPLLTVQAPPKPAPADVEGKAAAPSAEAMFSTSPKATEEKKVRVLAANPQWCENPQYVLKLPRGLPPTAAVEAMLVLRRTDLKPSMVRSKGPKGFVEMPEFDERAPGIGLVVSKVAAPEDPADRRRRTKQENSMRTNALGEKLPSKESSLRHAPLLQQLAEANAAAGDPGHGARLPLERKSVMSAQEWHLMTDFGNRVVCALKLPPLSASFCPDGLLVVPSLAEAGSEGRFSVEVFSDCEGLRLEPLPDGRAKALSASWDEPSAGGNHMQRGTWKKNPRFHLKLHGADGPVRVKITLSRPPGPWKALVAKDSLGCMLGFYVCRGPNPARGGGSELYHEGEPWTETPFVPTHSVSTPPGFELPPMDGEVFTIIPTTFEPGKCGPFVISVTADVNFTLAKDAGRSAEAPATKPKAGGFGGLMRK